MATITIKRGTVLRAIKQEPLGHQGWIKRTDDIDVVNGREGCTVCAVGAILRQVVKPSTPLDEFHMMAENSCVFDFAPDEDTSAKKRKEHIEMQLKEKDYMGALSYFFESSQATGKRQRERLRKFVLKHFPKRIKLDVIPSEFIKN